MRSADYVGGGGRVHEHPGTADSARPTETVDAGVNTGTTPGCPVLGPFSFVDHHAMGLFYGEYAFFYRVPVEFDESASAEIGGVRTGTASVFGPFEVPRDPAADEFGELGYGDFIGQEFGLPPGTYVGFIYRPDDLDAARASPTTDGFTVTLDDGAGTVVTSPAHAITMPALGSPAG
jgi:hypothetical protein